MKILIMRSLNVFANISKTFIPILRIIEEIFVPNMSNYLRNLSCACENISETLVLDMR